MVSGSVPIDRRPYPSEFAPRLGPHRGGTRELVVAPRSSSSARLDQVVSLLLDVLPDQVEEITPVPVGVVLMSSSATASLGTMFAAFAPIAAEHHATNVQRWILQRFLIVVAHRFCSRDTGAFEQRRLVIAGGGKAWRSPALSWIPS